jgi:hypothetical protein
MVVGFLGLNLKEDPLKSWLQRTSAGAQARHSMSDLCMSSQQMFV